MATQQEIERFLAEIREKIRVFGIVFRPRKKNLDALLELDIVPIDRINYLCKLTSENYYRGPRNDTHNPDRPDYYEFGMQIKGVEVYIKISLGLNDKPVDCMSFHNAERPIWYPLKKKES